MKKVLFIACTCLLTTIQLFAQDLTQNYRKLILNSSNSTSLFQSNSSNGVWASGMIATDRWGIFEDATTAKERFTILPGGNTGIGTTSPDAKLSVKGNIHANEIKVDLLGAVAPDYVFYKDYHLKTLQDVENYIEQEGHLPNIPSAKTMENQGIMLKEMNLKLLEKIEELTLYTIDQEKRIKTLENQNDILKSQDEKIKRLEKKLMLLLKSQK